MARSDSTTTRVGRANSQQILHSLALSRPPLRPRLHQNPLSNSRSRPKRIQTREDGGAVKILPMQKPVHMDSHKPQSDLVGFATAIGSMTEEFAFFREQAKIHDIPLTYTDDTIGPVTRRYIDYLTKLATEGSYAELLTGVWAAERVCIRIA